MGDTTLDLEAIQARCEALDERMNDMGELAWILEVPNHYGLFTVIDTEGNTVSRGIKERQDFIAHARRDIPALVAEAGQLRRELHDERVRRDEWEEMYNRLIAGTKVERLQTEHCAKSQGHWIGPAEAEGLRRRLKHAEDIRDFWIKEHDDLLQTIRRERQLRQEAERRAEVLEHERDGWRMSWESVTADLLNTRGHLERTEALAALVTEEMVALLEWLADKAEAEALSYLPHLHWTDPRIARTRALAARIREVLEINSES